MVNTVTITFIIMFNICNKLAHKLRIEVLFVFLNTIIDPYLMFDADSITKLYKLRLVVDFRIFSLTCGSIGILLL